MNLSVYIFGKFDNGYSQYPNDYANEISASFAQNAQAVTQIAVHRDGDLMYYGYIRKLEGGDRYIGLCAVINGKCITRPDRLFAVFEREIENMVLNGCLLHYDEKGELRSSVAQLYENREELKMVASHMQEAFEGLEEASQKLPPVSYGTAKGTVRSFTVDDDKEATVNSSCTNGYTYIYKNKGYNTMRMNSVKGVIAQKNKEIEDLRSECSELRNDKEEMEKRKRNNVWLFTLLGVAIGVLLGLAIVSQIVEHREVKNAEMAGSDWSVGNTKGETTEDKEDKTENKEETGARQESLASTCPATVTDVDGNTYNTVQIGNQCWMRENLRTTRYSDGTAIDLGADLSTNTAYRYCPNDDAGNVRAYGYLYNWKAVMRNSSSSSANPSGVQGVCPAGWHVPSDAEWDELEDYVSSQSRYRCGGSSTSIAKALASARGWVSSSEPCAVGNNPSGNNATGFSALPAGYYYGSFDDFGYDYASFWSSTEYNSSYAYTRSLYYISAFVSSYYSSKCYGFSVRCLRNQE